MPMQPSSKISFGIIFFVMIFVITVHLTILDFKSANAQKPAHIQRGTEIIEIKKPNVDEKNELVVASSINLQNISKTGMLKVVGVINGEGFIKDIPLDNLDETTKKLKVNFVMNKNNEINIAHKPDEFFICAYHFTNDKYNNEEDSNNINPLYADNQYNQPVLKYFDCNEGDIQSTTAPTEANLFKAHSLVYDKSAYYYNMDSQSPHQSSFATMSDDERYAPTMSDDERYAPTMNGEDDPTANNKNSNKPVLVKIIVPMYDKKNAQKIKIMAMLKGQIKSEIVDVQDEFKKIGGTTITRTFAFDRDTDMGPIQIGDRFHTCVIGKELYPPEGSECEKRLIKSLDRPNPLAAR